MDQTRRLLEDATRERRPCRVGRVGAAWMAGSLCRMETGGLVCSVPGHLFRAGEEVRLRLEDGEAPQHFEASVLKVGVPIPDRSADGLLLGFLAAVRSTGAAGGGSVLELLLPAGPPLSLLDEPVHLVDVGSAHLDFEVPVAFPVLFPVGGNLRIRIGEGTDLQHGRARVERVVAGEHHVLYEVIVEEVERQVDYQRAVRTLRAALGR